MSPHMRSAICFTAVMVVLTAVVIWVQKRWPEYGPQAEVALSTIWVVYFLRSAVKQDRAGQLRR